MTDRTLYRTGSIDYPVITRLILFLERHADEPLTSLSLPCDYFGITLTRLGNRSTSSDRHDSCRLSCISGSINHNYANSGPVTARVHSRARIYVFIYMCTFFRAAVCVFVYLHIHMYDIRRSYSIILLHVCGEESRRRIAEKDARLQKRTSHRARNTAH